MQTITVIIKNNTAQTQSFAAFGFNPSPQSSPGVQVSVSQSSISQATKESANNPFIVKNIKVITNNGEQMNEPFYIAYKTASGLVREIPFTPENYSEPEYKRNIVNIKTDFVIGPDMYIKGNIAPNTQLTLNLTVKQRFSSFLESVLSILNNTKVFITGRFR